MTKLASAAFYIPAVSLLLLGNAFSQDQPASAAPSLTSRPASASDSAFKTPAEKLSYALGMNMATSFKRQGVEVDPNQLAQGIKDSMAGKTLLTDDEAKATLTQAQNDLRAKMEEKQKAAGEANKKEGADFLTANKTKEGVVALPSGLQYKIVKAGTGPKPAATDKVVCNYRGTLIDGKEFDSSYKRGEPATFPVNGVIKGWTEALQLMPVGSKWELFVPSDLAYGERGVGADIGPNATLIFEVELMSIAPKDSAEKK